MGPARNMGRWTDTGTEEIPVKSVSVSEGRRFSPEIDPEDNSVTFREDDELFGFW